MKKVFAAALALCLLLCFAVPAMADNGESAYFQSILDAYSDRLTNGGWDSDLDSADPDDTPISIAAAWNQAYSSASQLYYAVLNINSSPVLLIGLDGKGVDAFTGDGRIFQNNGGGGGRNYITVKDSGNLYCNFVPMAGSYCFGTLVSVSAGGDFNTVDSWETYGGMSMTYAHNGTEYNYETYSEIDDIIASYGSDLSISWTPLTAGCLVEDAGVQTIGSTGSVPEEPVEEDPFDEEPVNEEPIDEEPVDEEPINEEPVEEEPIDEEPVDEEPINEEPVEEEPIDEEPVDDGEIDVPASDTDTDIDTDIDTEPLPSEPVTPDPIVPEDTITDDDFPVTGEAGEVSWSLTEDGTLTFSGSGSMGSAGMLPVTEEQVQTRALLQELTTTLVIEDGVTDISDYAFQGFTQLTAAALPESMTSVGPYAFDGCDALYSVTYAGTTAKWNNITVGENNTPLTEATIQCSDGTINETAASDDSGMDVIREDDEIEEPITTTPVVYADVVFVLDLSGSMNSSGRLRDMKDAVNDMINSLSQTYPNSTVHYQLITFADSMNYRTNGTWQDPDAFYDSYIANLSAGGGTNFQAALTTAGGVSWESGYTRIVVFLTDGVPTYHGTSTCGGGNSMNQADYEGALAGVATISCDRLYILGVDLSTSGSGNYNSMTPRQILDALAARASGARTKAVSTTDSVDLDNWFRDLASDIANDVDPVTPLPGVIQDGTVNGKCGDNCTWYLDNDGTLVVQGTGPMYDYEIPNSTNIANGTAAPWMSYADSITAVRVESGVTRVGNYAFYGLKNLVSVTLADTVAAIGRCAFAECVNLSRLSFCITLTAIEEGAFSDCNKLTDVYYDGTQTDWNNISDSFNNNSGIINNGVINIHIDGHHDAPATPTPGVVHYTVGPKTGDETPITLYIGLTALLLAAFAGVSAMLARRSR